MALKKSLKVLRLLCTLAILLPSEVQATINIPPECLTFNHFIPPKDNCQTNEDGPPNRDGPYKCTLQRGLTDFTHWPSLPAVYRKQIYPHDCCTEQTEGRRVDYPQGPRGGHRMKEETFASEGRSFCIVGEHIIATGLVDSPQLSGFAPLLIYNLDIGTHILPTDTAKMNSVNLQKTVTHTPSKTARTDERYRRAACEFSGVEAKDDQIHAHAYDTRPAVTEDQPDPSCVNPYEIQVTEIHSHERRLHNYLHVRVVARRITRPDPAHRCPQGKMNWLMLEARDHRGLPVGHFTTEVPCDKEAEGQRTPPGPGGIRGFAVFGKDRNILPCMYSPRDAISHPGIFLVSSSSEGIPYFTEAHATWRFAQHTSDFISEIHFVAMIVEDAKPLRYFTSRKENFKATSRCNPKYVAKITSIINGAAQFPIPTGAAQIDCTSNPNFAYNCKWDVDPTLQEWHWDRFNTTVSPQGVILYKHAGSSNSRFFSDDLLTYNAFPPSYDGLRNEYSEKDKYYSVCGLSNDTTNVRPYGYIAEKKILRPKMTTLGGWDYIHKDYVVPDYVDCHKPLSSFYFSMDNEHSPYTTWMFRGKNLLPRNHESYDVDADYTHPPFLYQPPAKPEDGSVLFMSEKGSFPWKQVHRYFQTDPMKLHTLYSLDKKRKTYLGTRETHKAYGNAPDTLENEQLQAEIRRFKFSSMVSMGDPERCPCPDFPTTPRPEEQTKPPLELDGRRLHGSQMLIAWMVLIPIALFSARYYKETYSRVFFMQEFWWYTIHVLTLITALVFMIGGIYVHRLNKVTLQVDTLAIRLHRYFGWAAIILFVIQLVTGPFRVLKVKGRLLQMTLHWLFGMVEYILGVASIFLAGVIKQGFLNCEAFGIFVAFLVVQLTFHVIMDVQMRISDKKMRLRPPRSYLPPPIMRIFHTNAPYARFRMFMLFLYYITCICFYIGMQLAMDRKGMEDSCYQPEKVVSDFIET